MSEQARLGDMVKISCPHGPQIGVIVSGDNYRNTDKLKTARLTDKVVCCACGQSGNIVTGSNNTFVSTLAAARVGDSTVGTCNIGCKECPHTRSGIIITGSTYTNTQ